MTVNTKISIVNAEGKTVLSMNGETGSVLTSADISKLSTGNYLLVINNGNERLTLLYWSSFADQ